MLRRDFVIGPSALFASVSACDSEPDARHVQTSEATPPSVPSTLKPDVPPPPAPPHDAAKHAAAGPDEPAMRVAGACIGAGQVCLQHCLGLLGVGDVALAACARAVNDMIAVSQAMMSLAAAGAPELKALAAVAVAVVTRCEDCCREQAAHHEACRDCAARCAAALKEYKRLAA